MYKILLLGCGFRRDLDVSWKERPEEYQLITLDNNSNTNPHYVFDLDDIILPFNTASFNEIHAYEVLEHTGIQGDAKFFFDQWNEFYRVLKPGGVFFGSVPRSESPWAFGDPGHRRVLHPYQLNFLSRDFYKKFENSKSDYQYLMECDFNIIHTKFTEHKFFFGLQSIYIL